MPQWLQGDPAGRNVFQGGFLGLDNIGVFDRSKQLPTGGEIQQSDATNWCASGSPQVRLGFGKLLKGPPVLRFFAGKLSPQENWSTKLVHAFQANFGPDC